MNLGPTWIVVADAGRARFFARRLPKSPLTELSDLAMTAPPLDAPSDRPSRVHDRKGPTRHAVEPRKTPRAAAANSFLSAVAERINAGAQDDAFERLVVCAAPRALGLLRDGLADAAKSRIVAAFDKDLTRESVQGVQQHLDNLAP
jgi:protein required for attachment to host cells